ncbi:NCS2 family permease [Caldisalinibacter kiritimatiensis]|uniref:Xanthine/uracil/thiamine/ascorbate permease family protein n=1 Tax=Caldisalinibacter kiritimatiensis TaxID=1304284 RepID=R1CTZ9_9FIRM|nr:NCS2 family permease [Caldisalinibacter kiritimatiensis]EOD00164.1 Xanthine/uracil/thiamine/ascorbate permease family protein [Caldisalinibacter kiritimatiensis]
MESLSKSSIFKLKENGTNVKTEIMAGITTFVTMAYIIFVNPNILKLAGMNTQGVMGDAAAGIGFEDPIVGAVFVATCIAAAIGTFIMGFFANLPFALAPGMGLNAFFTYSVVMGLGYTWQEALAAVCISGMLFIVLTITGLREAIVDAIPDSLKRAIGGGIGLFIALIGFKQAHIIVSNPATLVSFGDFTKPEAIVPLIGLVIVGVLMSRNVKGSILIGIVATTLLGIPFGITNVPDNFTWSIPSLKPTLFALDFKGLLNLGEASLLGALMSVITVVISFSLVDMFDTVGTLIGTGAKAGFLDENGKLKNMNKALFADAIATSIGAFIGTSTTTTYVESASGVSEGGRTGLTAVTVGVLFILSLFLAPFVGIVPAEATAPALIVVGVLMMTSVKHIDFEDFTEALPAFLTMAIMPFSYSIANGIAAGLIFYPLTKLVTGKGKEVHPAIYILAVLFILRFTILPH